MPQFDGRRASRSTTDVDLRRLYFFKGQERAKYGARSMPLKAIGNEVLSEGPPLRAGKSRDILRSALV